MIWRRFLSHPHADFTKILKIETVWGKEYTTWTQEKNEEKMFQSSIWAAESIENVFYGLPDVWNAQPTPNSREEPLIWR